VKRRFVAATSTFNPSFFQRLNSMDDLNLGCRELLWGWLGVGLSPTDPNPNPAL
jgi:hypothetical protein